MNTYLYKELRIEIVDEPMYNVDSTDNKFNYSKQYFGEEEVIYPTSKHGIKIYENEILKNDCIIIGSGGATGILKTSSLLDKDNLIICCCNAVFCLSLPSLDLSWKVKADEATCFQIFKLENDYIVHGEIEVTRLTNKGEIKWQFSGSDIFVTMSDEIGFELNSDHIMLTDFCNTKYKLNFDGKLI